MTHTARGDMKAKRSSSASPRRPKPEPARRVPQEHYRERYLKLSPRLLEPSQRVGVALGLLLEDGTLAPGRSSSANKIIELLATLTNAVAGRPNVAERSLIIAVLDGLASPDARYRRTHNKLAKNLPTAKFRGRLLSPTVAETNRDAEVRRELLALAAEVEGGPPPDLPPVLPPVQRETAPVPVVPSHSAAVVPNEEAAAVATAALLPEDADSDDTETPAPEELAAETVVYDTETAAHQLQTEPPNPNHDLEGYLRWLKLRRQELLSSAQLPAPEPSPGRGRGGRVAVLIASALVIVVAGVVAFGALA